MKQERNFFTASDGVRVSYLDIGAGIPFLLIHGWGGNAEGQRYLLAMLAAKGFRCLCFDQRGCGESKDITNLSINRSATDAKDLIEHLGLENVMMLGYSMGAAVMFAYLELFGSLHLSRVVVGDMSPKPLNDEDWKLGLYQGWYTKEQFDRDLYNMEHDYEAFSAFFVDQTIFKHTPDEIRTFDEGAAYAQSIRQKGTTDAMKETIERLIASPDGNRYANRLYWESCDSRDYRPIMKTIAVPVGLFFARPGSLYSPEIATWMEGQIKQTETYYFDDCTHLACGEKPKEFVEALATFFTKSFETNATSGMQLSERAAS